MSSPDPQTSPASRWAPRAARVAAALLALALSGCLRPLYGPATDSGDVSERMKAIAIVPISDRAGHYLENELRFGFNGTGETVAPRYRLYVGLRESVQSALVDTVTGYPSGATIVISAEYTLVPEGGGATITKGVATAVSSYDRTAQRYANLRASRDAEIRNARLLAGQIRANIAAALAEKG